MKECKVRLYIAITAFICFVAIPLAINALFKIPAPCPLFEAEWEAGEAMGYVSGSLTFIGTMFLGWVSWKQNRDLQKKQDDTFIAENSCIVLLGNVNFKIGQKNAVTLSTHSETIACSDTLFEDAQGCRSFECEITLQHIKNIPVVVRVLSATIFVDNQIAEFTKYDDYFTRVAVFKEYSKFNLTLLMPAKEKQEIGNLINGGNYPVNLEIKFEVVSDRYVSTTLKCRSTLSHCGIKNNARYASNDDASMSFGYGSKILKQSDINFRVQEAQNGQAKI